LSRMSIGIVTWPLLVTRMAPPSSITFYGNTLSGMARVGHAPRSRWLLQHLKGCPPRCSDFRCGSSPVCWKSVLNLSCQGRSLPARRVGLVPKPWDPPLEIRRRSDTNYASCIGAVIQPPVACALAAMRSWACCGAVNASAMTPKKEAVISTAATNANMRIVVIGVSSIWDVVLLVCSEREACIFRTGMRGISAEMIHRRCRCARSI
jgi:hypothetical protein